MALEDGLLGYWLTDEVSGQRFDVSGNARTLDDHNSVTSQAGVIGNAAEFTRANQERLKRTDTGLRSVGDTTVLGTVNIASLAGFDGSYGAGVVAHMTGDSIGDYWLGITDGGRVHFAHWESAGADADGRARSSGVIISTGSFIHVIGRRLLGVLSIWTNGVSRALDSNVTTDSGWGTNGFNVGANWVAGGGAYHMNGLIDMPGVWNRGLSDAEIAEVYNGGAGWIPFSAGGHGLLLSSKRNRSVI